MEKIIKKKVLVVLLVVLMALVVGAVACTLFVRQGKVWAEQEKIDADKFSGYIERQYEKLDEVDICLTIEETRKFNVYTPEDFKDIGAISVRVWGSNVDEYVKGVFQGLPIDEEFEEKYDINVETYKRWLTITLNKKSKKNVIRVTNILAARPEIDYVYPSLSGGACSAISDDKYSSDQWGIENANVDKAWEKIHDGEPVIVGVLDRSEGE